MSSNAVSESLKAAGAASVIGATVAGITLQDWAAIAALTWTLWLLYDKAADKFKKWRLRHRTRHDDAVRRTQARVAARRVRQREHDGE